jgi:hypothetical protein
MAEELPREEGNQTCTGQQWHGTFDGRACSQRSRGRRTRLYPVSTGPTAERIAKADNHYAVGDDKRGNRVYHFHDCPLDRMYSRLTRQAQSPGDEASLRREYIALTKYHHHWRAAGLQDSIGSADLNRIFAADPGSMSGMAKTERQAHHRKQYREARDGDNGLGHKAGIVVDNVVCAGTSIEAAGWAIGSFTSRTSARDGAERILRESGRKLARLWGIS